MGPDNSKAPHRVDYRAPNPNYEGRSDADLRPFLAPVSALMLWQLAVTIDVSPYEIVAGNAARTIRKRFNDEDIARLLAAKWWDWPVDKITEHTATIMSGTPAEIEQLASR